MPATISPSNCAVERLGNVVLVRTLPKTLKCCWICSRLSFKKKSHVRKAFSRGSPSADVASSFSERISIRCVMFLTSTWY